ncbi:FAD-dependent oxidoreductase [Streptomyces sp. NPDC058745]|uniref:FAD-dependent oxidoreductase n=1 Tax=Streptomyces sp. NPDC058745 TaxID=3346621 RepID=UPI003694B975
MTRSRSVLVIGGGTAGCALAVLLARAGTAVDLVERSPDGNAGRGSGITLQGNALRVLDAIGVWDRVRARGAASDGVTIVAPDGTPLVTQDDLRTGGDDLPAALGMRRPVLQGILTDAVLAAGARFRPGRTLTHLAQDSQGAQVRFDDGTSGRYDLVVAADGVHSATRALIGITETPRPTGMAVWRAPAPRPEGVDRTHLAFGGPAFIAGFCPTGPDTVYAYLVEAARDRTAADPVSLVREMRERAEGYGGHWKTITAALTDTSPVNYTWCTEHLVDGPWYRGRVVLVGDAAHSCPPTLAQGAAMSLEDSLVLAELLTEGSSWDDKLLDAYTERRLPRVRSVVEASVQIGRWQLDGVRDADVPGLMGRVMGALRERP